MKTVCKKFFFSHIHFSHIHRPTTLYKYSKTVYADIDDIHAVHLCQIIIYVQAFYFVSKKIVISYHDKVVMFIRFSQDISRHSINVS